MDLVMFHWSRMMPSLAPHISVPSPSYTQARENLVKAIPPKILCLLACGGRDCRYEGPECWSTNQQVIRGLFSSWWAFLPAASETLLWDELYLVVHLFWTSPCCRVTDNIIAMARPSNHLIEEYNIIEQFQRLTLFGVCTTVLCICASMHHTWVVITFEPHVTAEPTLDVK